MDKLPSKNIIIKIDNKEIHFSPNLSIPVRNSNLPMDYMTFRYYVEIYWKIELIEYLVDSKCLHAKVLVYTMDFNAAFDKQTTTKVIDKVIFDKLDWQKLQPLLIYFKYVELIENLYNLDIKKVTETKINVKPKIGFNQAKYETPKEVISQPAVQIKHVADVHNLKFNFSIKFQDAHFTIGYVTFKKTLKKIGNQLDFKIQNDYILEEFDNIKVWFAKKLNTKKFDVSATIKMIDNCISEIIAVSPQIELINPVIIDSVKYDRTIALTKPPKSTNPNKSLYTTEDIFKMIDPEESKGNIFGQSEIDIIKTLSQTYQVRNYKQLEFLSVSKQDTNSIMHFTLSPQFGFLFLIEGNMKHHFVWELLQSHATYLWSIEKENNEIAHLYKKIEEIINEIRRVGRDQYKKTYDEKNPKFGFSFNALEHQDISINIDDGFIKWKSKLEALLT
jgi:hypothetical protein